MKKIISILVISLFLFSFNYDTETNEYNEGFLDGYCEGYVQAYYDIKKIEPVCPPDPVPLIPDPGRDTYKHGYNQGFQYGYIDASEEIE